MKFQSTIDVQVSGPVGALLCVLACARDRETLLPQIMPAESHVKAQKPKLRSASLTVKRLQKIAFCQTGVPGRIAHLHAGEVKKLARVQS